MTEIPHARKCIGQVVLDWEFLHDLDLHLLKVQQPGRAAGGSPGVHNAEPSPEPAPQPNTDLKSLIVTDASGQRLRGNVALQSIVSYRQKVHNPSGAQTPEAVLEVDRNAAVHSLKPVENLYLTETLGPGAYVVGVHNYSLRQLADTVIGPSHAHQYKTYEEFKKMDPGYQKMQKALDEQNAHAGDPDGTPEKQAIMARVDQEMNQGSRMIQSMCHSGTNSSGVHYGITVYSYPEQWTTAAKHPQVASVDELQNLFQSGFFATADFVFDPTVNTVGYNGANVVADVTSQPGKLALGNKKAAAVALLKIVKDASSGKSKISEVIMLDGLPQTDVFIEHGSAFSPMNALRSHRTLVQGPRGGTRQLPEPFQEPRPLHQMPTRVAQVPMHISQMPAVHQPSSQPTQPSLPASMQQPFPEPCLQPARLQMPAQHAFSPPMHQASSQRTQPSPTASMQQPFPEPGLQLARSQMPVQHALSRPVCQPSSQPTQPSLPASMQQPYPQPGLQQARSEMPMQHAFSRPVQHPPSQPTQPSLPASLQRSLPEPFSEPSPQHMPVQQQPTFGMTSQHQQISRPLQMPRQQRQTPEQPQMPMPQQRMPVQRQLQTGLSPSS